MRTLFFLFIGICASSCIAATGNLNPESLALHSTKFIDSFDNEEAEFKALCDNFSEDFDNTLIDEKYAISEISSSSSKSSLSTLEFSPNEKCLTQLRSEIPQKLPPPLSNDLITPLVVQALTKASYTKEQIQTLETTDLPSLKMLVQCFYLNNEAEFQQWLRSALQAAFPDLDREQITIVIYFLITNGPITSLKIGELIDFTTRTATKRCNKWIKADFFKVPDDVKNKRRYYLSDSMQHRLNNFPAGQIKQGLAICMEEVH